MSNPIIWHNPRCSKSRATLEMLVADGHMPTIVEYRETPPSETEIRHALSLLGLTASDLVRKKDRMYKECNLENADEDELIRAMAEHPILIERPIVFSNGKAALGRPPEAVKKIL